MYESDIPQMQLNVTVLTTKFLTPFAHKNVPLPHFGHHLYCIQAYPSKKTNFNNKIGNEHFRVHIST